MSFLDELNEVSKTKYDVNQERKEYGRTCARLKYDSIKEHFINMAKNGRYTTVSGKKYIEFYDIERYIDFDVKADETRTKGLFQSAYRYTTKVNLIIKDRPFFNGYVDELKKRGFSDGINIVVLGYHNSKKNDPSAYFDIDKEYVCSSSKIFCSKINFSIVLKCSACY